MSSDSEEDFICPQCNESGAGKMPAVALAHQVGRKEDVVLCSLRCLVGFLKEHAIN